MFAIPIIVPDSYCPADGVQQENYNVHKQIQMRDVHNVDDAKCMTEPLFIPVIKQEPPVVPKHEADVAPVEVKEERKEQPEPEVFTGEELKKGLGLEVMKRIELAKAVFDDQPNLGHHTYPDKKKDDGTPRESYAFLKGYKNCFSYAYYFEKKEKEDTAKAFSFISDGYLYATNLRENLGREVFALRIKLDNMNPEDAPKEETNYTKTTPVFKVISCSLCMYFYEETKLTNKEISHRIYNIIKSMSPVVQNRILVQLVKGRDVETILTEDKVDNHLFKTVRMTRENL